MTRNQVKQHSKLWYKLKSFYFGANDCASILGHGYNTVDQVISDKIQNKSGLDAEVTKFMEKGTRYEPVVKKLCEIRNGINILETGLKHHNQYHWLTASPDGYFIKSDGTKSLVEFKVRSVLSDGSIPYKFWIQMQIQMAVWGIERCLYCENIIDEFPDENTYNVAISHYPGANGDFNHHGHNEYYWRLREYREIEVEYDPNFFAQAIKQLEQTWKQIRAGRCKTRSTQSLSAPEPVTKKAHTESPLTIYPWMINNYIRNDKILDWLNLYGDPELKDQHIQPFLTMIKNKHLEFGSLVRNYIKTQYNEEGFIVDIDYMSSEHFMSDKVTIEPHKLSVSNKSISDTTEAMKKYTPIIMNPCFSFMYQNVEVRGHADMIILNHYIDKIFSIATPDPPDQYSLVSIKFATINQRTDGIHLLNNSKQKIYKAQLCLLNKALGINSRAYIIGRKYDYTSKGEKFKLNNAFESIGVVDFSKDGIDYEYNELINQAIKWQQTIHQPSMKSYHPLDISKHQQYDLLPNMKNHTDYPWSEYKKHIAKTIGEITLMYRCGTKLRKQALENGICKWTDLVVNTDQINGFIKKNTTDKLVNYCLPNGNHPKIECFIDFEAIGNTYDDFKTFPVASDYAMIFLIGVVVVDHTTQSSKYYTYIIDQLDKKAEKRMILKMLDDMNTLCQQQPYIPLIFWGNAEKYMLERALKQEELQKFPILMVDLCKLFREQQIIYPGQFSYGLKEVATVMHRHKLIQTQWKHGDICNGLNAMVEGIKNLAHRNDACLAREFYREVLDYNYVDCKVMSEIIQHLREQSN